MIVGLRYVSWCLIAWMMVALPAHAEPEERATLVVAVKEAPPFVMRDAEGGWRGLSVELWQQIASDVGLDFEYREDTLAGVLAGVESGRYAVGMAALTVTAEREAVIDFSHPYHSSGLGIAVVPREQGLLMGLASGLLSRSFLQVVAGLLTILGVVGLLVWLFERRQNPEQFGGHPARGLFEGLWWSAVTMTTVGYGDRVPITVGGRLVGLVWMFASIIMISSFTAAMASSLTVQTMVVPVEGPQDLARVRVGAVEGTTGAQWLARHGIASVLYPTLGEAMIALEGDRVEAVVHDAPMLQYLASHRGSDRTPIKVLPRVFHRQDYGFAFPRGSAHRKPVNQAMLKHLGGPEWTASLTGWLGER